MLLLIKTTTVLIQSRFPVTTITTTTTNTYDIFSVYLVIGLL